MPLTPEQKQEWKERARLQKESGLSVLQWCREHNVNYDSMLYWRRVLGLAPTRTINRSSFKELPDCVDNASITIECQRIQVHLPKNCHPDTLIKYLHALKEKS